MYDLEIEERLRGIDVNRGRWFSWPKIIASPDDDYTINVSDKFVKSNTI